MWQNEWNSEALGNLLPWINIIPTQRDLVPTQEDLVLICPCETELHQQYITWSVKFEAFVNRLKIYLKHMHFMHQTFLSWLAFTWIFYWSSVVANLENNCLFHLMHIWDIQVLDSPCHPKFWNIILWKFLILLRIWKET